MIEEESRTADVVVAGCGVAGLSAALAAVEAGARVIVLERAARDERGGNTRYTEAFLRMKTIDEASDDFAARLLEHGGVQVDPALMDASASPYSEWSPVERAMSLTDPEVVHAFESACGTTLRWLMTFGLQFEPIITPFITVSSPRLAPVGGGREIVERLATAFEGTGSQIHYRTAARDLLFTPDGRIEGIAATDGSGRRVAYRAEQVVLATGGFEGNNEMLSRYVGPTAVRVRPVARGGYYNRGDGIAMGLRAGAAPAGDFSLFHAEPIDPRSRIAEAAIFAFPYGILVNQDGRRFADEGHDVVDLSYEHVARLITQQRDGIAYLVLGTGYESIPRIDSAIRTDQRPVVADSVEELAGKLRLPAEALGKTIAEFNASCKDGHYDPLSADGLGTEGLTPPKSNWARPVEPPFAAYPMISANVFTFGGLKVNSRAQVIDLDGHPIAGLYAAGETMGLYFGRYTGSTSVLRGAVFGRMAGQHAAAGAGRR